MFKLVGDDATSEAETGDDPCLVIATTLAVRRACQTELHLLRISEVGGGPERTI